MSEEQTKPTITLYHDEAGNKYLEVEDIVKLWKAALARAAELERQLAECQAERDAYQRDAISARETQLIDERRAIEALRDGDALAAQLAECQEARDDFEQAAKMNKTAWQREVRQHSNWRLAAEKAEAERDAATAQLAECQEERASYQREAQSWRADLQDVLDERDVLQHKVDEPWHWQGDGHDCPESLTCPVLMSADSLRALLGERDAYQRDAISARETQLIDERRAIEALRDGDALAAQLAKCQLRNKQLSRKIEDLEDPEFRRLYAKALAKAEVEVQLGLCRVERDAATALAGELRSALEVVANKDKDGLYRYCQHCHGFTSVAAGWKTGEHLPVGHVSDCPVGAALAITPPEALQQQQERMPALLAAEAGNAAMGAMLHTANEERMALAALAGELQAFLLTFWTETRPVENGRIYLSERNWNGWYERASRLWEQEPPEALQRQQERERRLQAVADASKAFFDRWGNFGSHETLDQLFDAVTDALAALAERGGEGKQP